MKNSDKDSRRPSASFVAGAVALVFLIIGYQSALFIHKASIAKIIADHDSPDTVFLADGIDLHADGSRRIAGKSDGSNIGESSTRKEKGQSISAEGGSHVSAYSGMKNSDAAGTESVDERIFTRRDSPHSEEAVQIRRAASERRYENFPFNPNTASIDDLMRLGFSQKQAQSIDSYRQKGGRFRRKSDFARSYVVADSVFRRLEPFIRIPQIDINAADSAAFESLPGIGRFFASRMVSYREELGGYSFKEQLMDIWHFDQEKFDGLEDLITVGESPWPAFGLWTLSEKDLARHPYIDQHAAHSIVLFRENSPKEEWTVANLVRSGILDEENGRKLAGCRIASPNF